MQVSHDTESMVEERLIELLGIGENQWTYRPDLKTEDDLWNNLRQKIVQKNLSEIAETPLTDNEFEKIKTELLLKTQTPFDAAKWLKGENGIARITIDRDDVNLGRMSVILFTNNEIGGGFSSYEVVNQIELKKNFEHNQDRRLDVTLLINGLPIIHVELKQTHAKDGVFAAFNQIKKYAEEGLFRGNIFSTLQLFVISNEQTTRYFANSMPQFMNSKFLFTWRTPDNQKIENIYEFARLALKIPDAHRLISHYTIVSEDQDNKVLMVLRPYQIHAIEALYDASKNHQSGYIWHATGSGKTLTSFVSTKLLARKPGIDRTIMLVDRKDLDSQTTSEFTKFASEFNTGISTGDAVSNSLIVGTGSSHELAKELLSDANSNTIIITTRQKLDAALRYAQRQTDKNGTERFKKLKGQHMVFIVDECHRALSSEGMEGIKEYFPNSTWYGFTGTPIFEVNKKQAQGQRARTTHDQYGEVLHTYTIKNALDDNSVLGFQVEHEDTIEPVSLNNHIYSQIEAEKGSDSNPDSINESIENMDGLEKEKLIDSRIYTSDEHIEEVIRKIFNPNNAYNKFKFINGRPTMSAILTTSSIAMAKRYYKEIQKMKQTTNWMEENYKDHPIQKGKVINDPDFPRIAITYSLVDNSENASEQDDEMKQIIQDYNNYYDTAWSISDIERYNSDINNRLARKKAEFKVFGKQVDLVIVVDRLLTGFDAPTIQTLYVDRNLTYANLIQAFSRTNRTYPDKTKGMIVSFRKPHTMAYNVEEATTLYSHPGDEHALIYPPYSTAKSQFKKAHKVFKEIITNHPEMDEKSLLTDKVEFVKAFQALSNAHEAIITYDEYNGELEKSTALREQAQTPEEYIGLYNTIKGSLVDTEAESEVPEFQDINFYSDNTSHVYNVDSAFINQLLGNISEGDYNAANEFIEMLRNNNIPETVIQKYDETISEFFKVNKYSAKDIFMIKHQVFNQEIDNRVEELADEFFVSKHQLQVSAAQYNPEDEHIANIKHISDSLDRERYRENNPGVPYLKTHKALRESWKKILDEVILPLKKEL